MKSTYIDSKNKILTRNYLFSKIKEKNIVGLAGPDINNYISSCKKLGFKEIEVWENDLNTVFHQLKQLKHAVRFRIGDIQNVEIRSDTFYDLDYCKTIQNIEVKKFDKFIMTFALRGCGKDETINTFVEKRGEVLEKITELELPKRTIIKTNKSSYLYTSYRDNTPMCCISKFI